LRVSPSVILSPFVILSEAKDLMTIASGMRPVSSRRWRNEVLRHAQGDRVD